jgi:hypothetical protein
LEEDKEEKKPEPRPDMTLMLEYKDGKPTGKLRDEPIGAQKDKHMDHSEIPEFLLPEDFKEAIITVEDGGMVKIKAAPGPEGAAGAPERGRPCTGGHGGVSEAPCKTEAKEDISEEHVCEVIPAPIEDTDEVEVIGGDDLDPVSDEYLGKIVFISHPAGIKFEDVRRNRIMADRFYMGLRHTMPGAMFLRPHSDFSRTHPDKARDTIMKACMAGVKACDILAVCGKVMTPGMETEYMTAGKYCKTIVFVEEPSSKPVERLNYELEPKSWT